MPYEMTLDGLPGGYSINAARSGEIVQVETRGFVSTEDGEHFVTKLEGIPDDLLSRLPPDRRLLPSEVDHLFAIIRRDRTATVYVNELQMAIQVRARRPVKPREPVGKDAIADIHSLKLFPKIMNPSEPGLAVPSDAGLVFLFSIRWRKGLFFDLTPLSTDAQGNRPVREIDVGGVLGQVYARLMFQERFSITDSEWDILFASQWFLFVGLPDKTIEEVLAHVRAGWSIDELTARMVGDVKERAPRFLEAWATHPAFEQHLPILRSAVERFLSEDYVSSAGLVFPRIEGLLRSNHVISGVQGKATQEALSKVAVGSHVARGGSILLPHRFERYLREVYFADFDPKEPNIGISRNSVGHGVASADRFNAKAAAIGLLVVEQLFFSFERPTE